MRYIATLVPLVCVLLTGSVAHSESTQSSGIAATTDLHFANAQWIATATFREAENQVLITITLRERDLLTGTHGVQIHDAGRCYPPAFENAGDIFNPFGKQHGLANPSGPMAGDLPNLTMDPGELTYNLWAPLVTLRPGPASLLREGGTSLLIFERPDDGRTPPEGNAGTRLACGAIVVVPGSANSPGLGGVFGGPTPIIGGLGVLLAGAGLALRRWRR
jgi:Cu-Zn family superoxide dismutase